MKKSMNEQIAEELIEQLEAGTSPFQKAGFNLPINPTTGKHYRGMTALQLAMLDKADPRYMTLRQASNAGWKIEKGSKGILINFLKTQDRVKLLNDDGSPMMNSNNKQKTQLIKLDKPISTNAFVFNADQIEEIPALAEFLEERAARHNETGSERLAAIAGKAMEDVPELDLNNLPEPVMVQDMAEYLGNAIDAQLGNPVANQMRTTVASLMVNANLSLDTAIEPGIDFAEWAELLKAQPAILETVMTQAQYIADDILKLEPKKEMALAARAERVLLLGDKIPYNETNYEVMAKMAKNTLQIQEESTGNKFRISPGDGIYNSLLQAKKNAMQQQPEQTQEEDMSMQHEHEQELEEGAELELNLGEEQEQSTGRKR